MPTTVELTLYRFDELSDAAKERARNWWREDNPSDGWWDDIQDDAKAMAARMGIQIDRIHCSGFSSQGDGACFEGRYAYQKGSVQAVKDAAPLDTELHWIAQGLVDVQRPHFYRLEATVKHEGHYYHEYCTEIVVSKDGEDFYASWYRDDQQDGADVVELLRKFMRWIYRRLEEEYAYLNRDETIDAILRENDWLFTARGVYWETEEVGNEC